MLGLYCPNLPPVPSGVADHTLRLARALEALGAPPSVIGQRGDVTQFAGLPTALVASPLDVAAVAQRLGVSTLVVQYVPFLYARRGVSLALVRALGRIRHSGLGLAAIVHEPYVPFTRLPWLVTGLPMRWQFRTLVRACGFVYTPVPHFARLVERYSAPGTTVRVAPVGSNIPVIPVSRDEARGALGLASHDVAIGVFSPAASGYLHTWVAAAASRLGISADVVWVFLGTGSDNLPRGFPASAHHKLLGYLEAGAVSRVLAALDLAAAPFVDGLTLRRGSVMAELAHGVPIVSSTGPLYDPVAGGLAACEPTAESFGERIAQLVRDPNARAAIGTRALRYAEVASVEVLARRILADLGKRR